MMRRKTKKAQREVLYNQVGATAGATADAIPAIAQNPQIAASRIKIADLQQQRASWPKNTATTSGGAKVNTKSGKTQRQLDLETARAMQSIRNDYDTAVLEERTLAQTLEAAKADAQELSRKSVDYNVMEREAKSNRQVYESLLQREKELRVVSNSRANNVRLIDRAEVPKCADRAGPAGGPGCCRWRSAACSRSAWRSASTTSTTRSRRRKTSRGV